ncbi:MAG: alanine--tRNA ligase, partial [Chloroflexi bacterium]|nr:alanine--tRNA ligase [Chloroflexota bacterium]
IGDYSRELCGGTHLSASGQVGLLLVTSEGGTGAGVRRVEAVTGRGAEAYLQSRLQLLDRLEEKLGSADVEARIESLQGELRTAKRQIAELQRAASRRDLDRLLADAQDVDGIRVIAAEVNVGTREALRDLGDEVKGRIGKGVVVLGAAVEGRPAFLAMVTQGVGVHAGNLIKRVAQVAGGGGGGRDTLAEAAGRDLGKLGEALRQVPRLVQQDLGNGKSN